MPEPHLVFHHFGLAVRQPAAAAAYAQALGYEVGETVYDPLQNVRLALCTHPTAPAIEIISPGETKGPIDKLVQRFASGIVYHLCYSTDDLAAAISNLEDQGLHVTGVSPPKPAPLFGGRKVSFYYVDGIGLIEILEG